MSDTTRSGRGAPRRRIAGQRRPTADPARREDRASTSAAAEPITEEDPARTTPLPAAEPEESVTQSDSVVPEAAEDQAPGRLGKLLTVTIAVLLVLTLTAAVVLGIKAWQGREAEQARSQATAAATKAAQLVLSYDYRSLDKNFSAARATLTPQFAADFDQTTKVVAEQAKKTKATVKAEVREVGVRDGDANRVTLLVFVNQTTTSTITQGKPRVDLNRARFTMVRNGDQWLVQEIAGL
jgi:Mce-associated membrane protein